MGMNKDEMIESIVDGIIGVFGNEYAENKRAEIKSVVVEHVDAWQQRLVNEVTVLSAKINTVRSEYITGLRDAVDIINGSVGMEPIAAGATFDIFSDPAFVSTPEIEEAVHDALMNRRLRDQQGR